jgi:hypothetical protein
MWIFVIVVVLVVAAGAYLAFSKGSSTIDEKSLRERHRNVEREADLKRRPHDE